MTDYLPHEPAQRTGDREYFWFALLLIAVLATSVNPPSAHRSSAANVDAPVPQQ